MANQEKTHSGKSRCQRSVTRYVGNWPKRGQCSRAATIGAFCGAHSPIETKKREASATKKYEDRRRKWRIEKAAPHFLDILTRIAEGHNDPQTLARETVDALNLEVRG